MYARARIRTLAAISAAALSLALAACGGGDDESKAWPDEAPTSRYNFDTRQMEQFSADEVTMIEYGLEGLDALPRDAAEEITDAFFYGDWPKVCLMLDLASDEIERAGVLAVDSAAWHAKSAIFGEPVRFDVVDEFTSECSEEIARAQRVSNEAVGA